MIGASVGARLAVSIVTGANEALILQCLESLFRTTRGDPFRLSVNVVCNRPGSSVGARLRAAFPQVRVLENAQIRGFAANHNLTLRASRADFILVLNDDLIFLDGAVAKAIRFLEEPGNQDVGVLTPRLLNPDGSLQPCTSSFPTVPRVLLWISGIRDRIPTTPRLFWLARLLGRGHGRSRYWEHDRTCDVDTFWGAAMFVRGRALREVGEMDETSRVGGEETEWHRRFWDRGWRVVFFADAEVIHLGSQTVGQDPWLENEFFKGSLNYFLRHRSPAVYYALLVSSAVVLGLRTLLAVLRRDRDLAGRTRLGLRTALVWMRAGRLERGVDHLSL